MKTKDEKAQNPRKIKENRPDAKLKAEAKVDDGFAKSRALSPEEIQALKEQLEDLNQQNTIGG